MENRTEYLNMIKQRAYEVLEETSSNEMAWVSFISDMNKEPELQEHPAIALGTMLLASGNWNTNQDCKTFIDGFN